MRRTDGRAQRRKKCIADIAEKKWTTMRRYAVIAAEQSLKAGPYGKDDDVNTCAVLSVLFAFLLPFAGIIFGAVGLHSAKKTGGNGRRLAFVGLILSITIFVLMMTRILGIAVIAPAIKGGVSAP